MQYIASIAPDTVPLFILMCQHLDIDIQPLDTGTEARAVGVNLDRIKETVATVFEVELEEMVSKSRRHHLVRARNVCYTMAYDHLGMKLQDIGQSFSGRDHTTVLFGIDQIRHLARAQPHFRNQARAAEQALFPGVLSSF